MLKFLAIICVFFSSVMIGYADFNGDKKWNKANMRASIIQKTQSEFEEKKQKVIRDYKAGKISLSEAKQNLIQEKWKMIEDSKVEMKSVEDTEKNEKLNTLKYKVKQQLDIKMKKFDDLDDDKKWELYDKIIQRIDTLLENKNTLSKKQILLYWLLKQIFTEYKQNNSD